MDPAGTAWQYAAEDIPRDITILKSNVTLVYADGTKADVSNGVYQHHSYITAATKKLPSWFNCGTSKMLFESLSPGSLFIGGSEDKYGGYYTTPTGDLNSGYYISKEDKLIMNGDVINYTPADKIVYTLNEIEYIPGKAKGLMEASMYVMVPAQCEGQFGIISGAGRSPQFSVKGKAMTVTRDATILAFRGHLHGKIYPPSTPLLLLQQTNIPPLSTTNKKHRRRRHPQRHNQQPNRLRIKGEIRPRSRAIGNRRHGFP